MKPALTAMMTGLMLVGSALPAFAHATVTPTAAEPDTEVTLTFRSVVERQVLVNKRFEVIVPTSFEALGCAGPIGWTCELDTQTYAPFTHVSWDAAGLGGTPADISFDLTVRTPSADQGGIYLMRAIQTHGDDWVEPWVYEEEPYIAPSLQVGSDDTIVNGASSDQVPSCFGPATQPESYDAHDGQRHNDDCDPSAQTAGEQQPDEAPSSAASEGDSSSDPRPDTTSGPPAEADTGSLPDTGGGAALLGTGLLALGGVIRKRRG